MPDADLEQALPAIMGSAFGAAGQRCLAGSVCVSVGDEERHGELREALASAAAELVVGDGREPATDVCPMVSARGPREGRRGDRPGRGGRRPAADRRSRRRRPGRHRARPDDRRGRRPRERARPRRALRPAADGGRGRHLEEALEFLNGSRYGNAGAIFTRSGAAARAYRHGAEAGMLGVNVGVPAPVAWFPFSGWKDSIDGDLHANGSDAVDFYTRKKVVTSRW